MTGSGDNITLGFPTLEKAKVEGEVVEEGRDKKVDVMKYKAKSNYFKKYGHRQPFQLVRVTKI
jgi:large subunit ribosomal protein L21